MRSAVLLMAALAVAVAGCKKKNGQAPESGSGREFPVRVGGEGDATALQKVGRATPGDGQTLQIDLQRLASTTPGALFACWDTPVETQPIGRAVCEGDASKVRELTAANVNFVCRTDPRYGVVAAHAPLDLSDCAAWDVFAYQFEPALDVELVGRK